MVCMYRLRMLSTHIMFVGNHFSESFLSMPIQKGKRETPRRVTVECDAFCLFFCNAKVP